MADLRLIRSSRRNTYIWEIVVELFCLQKRKYFPFLFFVFIKFELFLLCFIHGSKLWLKLWQESCHCGKIRPQLPLCVFSSSDCLLVIAQQTPQHCSTYQNATSNRHLFYLKENRKLASDAHFHEILSNSRACRAITLSLYKSKFGITLLSNGNKESKNCHVL